MFVCAVEFYDKMDVQQLGRQGANTYITAGRSFVYAEEIQTLKSQIVKIQELDEGLQFRYSCCGLFVSALSISVDIVSLPFLSCLVPLFLLWLGGYIHAVT